MNFRNKSNCMVLAAVASLALCSCGKGGRQGAVVAPAAAQTKSAVVKHRPSPVALRDGGVHLGGDDSAVLKLGTLLDQADLILIGTVAQVVPGPSPDSLLATITLEENLRGSAPGAFTLRGSETDPSLPAFATGAQFLLFLKATADGFEPVGGLSGIVAISAGRLPATRALVQEWVNKGQAVRLADMRDDVAAQDFPAPPALVASMLDEMTLRLAPVDLALVSAMACDNPRQFLPVAQQWAILRVGPFKIADARPCVEQILASDADLGARLAAAETLGVLGDKRSLGVLEEILNAQKKKGPAGEEPGADGGLSLSAALAIGKIGDPSAVPLLARIVADGNDLALDSTIINALGLIGGPRVIGALTKISRTHPNPLIQQQAKETLEQIKQ